MGGAASRRSQSKQAVEAFPATGAAGQHCVARVFILGLTKTLFSRAKSISAILSTTSWLYKNKAFNFIDLLALKPI